MCAVLLSLAPHARMHALTRTDARTHAHTHTHTHVASLPAFTIPILLGGLTRGLTCMQVQLTWPWALLANHDLAFGLSQTPCLQCIFSPNKHPPLPPPPSHWCHYTASPSELLLCPWLNWVGPVSIGCPVPIDLASVVYTPLNPRRDHRLASLPFGIARQV